MTTRPYPVPHLHALRTLTATILAAALDAALTTDDRFASACREAQRATPTGNPLPGHRELLHRECTYRLAHAAQLAPRGLLAANLHIALEIRDHVWPHPIRRTALITALANLPAEANPALLHPARHPGRPTATTGQLGTAVHTAARHAATTLRGNRSHPLTHALTSAAQHATQTLPAGYDLLIEREMTLCLAHTLALPTTGALAPGLDPALAHAIRTTNRTDLADLILTAVRSTHPSTPANLGHVPTQRTRTGSAACNCACANGGFCGGCGHAGCSRR